MKEKQLLKTIVENKEDLKKKTEEKKKKERKLQP